MTVRLEPWGEDDLPLGTLLGDPVMMEHLAAYAQSGRTLFIPAAGPRLRRRSSSATTATSASPGAKITVDGVSAGWVGYWEHEREGESLEICVSGPRVANAPYAGGRAIYEMGWSVLPEFQGRGVAGEATRLALEAARATDGPRTVHAFPMPENGPSNAICRKLGFTLLGEVEFEFPKGHRAGLPRRKS